MPGAHPAGRPRAIEGPGALRDADRPVRAAPRRHAGLQAVGGMGARSHARIRPERSEARAVAVRPRLGARSRSWSRWSSRATCRSSATPKRGPRRRKERSSRTPIVVAGAHRRRRRGDEGSAEGRDRPDAAATRVHPRGSAAALDVGRAGADRAAAAGRAARPNAADTRAIAQTLREAGAGVIAQDERRRARHRVRARDAIRGRTPSPTVVLAGEHYNMIARMVRARASPSSCASTCSRTSSPTIRTATTSSRRFPAPIRS